MSKIGDLDIDKVDTGALIVCFDINSTREENQAKSDDNSEGLIENPKRIFNNFFDNHKVLGVEKNEINPSELNYKFCLNLPEKSTFQIRTISDLSFIHEISLNADSYIIFINLENPQTKEKIEYLMKYILESCCSVDIKTYIIGIYKEKPIDECKKEELENLFIDDNLSYEYFEIKYTENPKNHFCLYEFIANKNYDGKNFLKKHIADYQLTEMIEKIINETYENKNGLRFDPFKRKFVDKSEKAVGENLSGPLCNLF